MSKGKTADWLKDKSWHRIRNEMLISHAWRAASHLQRSMVTVLLSELGRHSGKDNGHLIFTNRDLAKFGFSRDSIKPNLIALEALGFISYLRGRSGLPGYGKARRTRLTFLPILDADGNEVEAPTDEWARFTTTEEAKMAVKRALKRSTSEKSVQKSDHYDSGPEIGPRSDNAQPPVERQVIEIIEAECRQIGPLSTSEEANHGGPCRDGAEPSLMLMPAPVTPTLPSLSRLRSRLLSSPGLPPVVSAFRPVAHD
jgi:hypothetical protein